MTSLNSSTLQRDAQRFASWNAKHPRKIKRPAMWAASDLATREVLTFEDGKRNAIATMSQESFSKIVLASKLARICEHEN